MNNRNAQQTVLFMQPIDFKWANPSTKRYRAPPRSSKNRQTLNGDCDCKSLNEQFTMLLR